MEVPGRALCHSPAVDPDQAAHMASATEDNEATDNAEAAAYEGADLDATWMPLAVVTR